MYLPDLGHEEATRVAGGLRREVGSTPRGKELIPPQFEIPPGMILVAEVDLEELEREHLELEDVLFERITSLEDALERERQSRIQAERRQQEVMLEQQQQETVVSDFQRRLERVREIRKEEKK